MIGIPFSEFREMRSSLLKKIKKASHAISRVIIL